MDVTASLIAVADPPLFLDQNGARRAKKKFSRPPPLSQSLNDCSPPPHPPNLQVWIRHWIESQPQGIVQ